MTTNNQDYPDFQGMGEDFTPEYNYGEQPPVLIRDERLKRKEELIAIITGQVNGVMRPVVEEALREFERIIDLTK